MPEGTDGIYDRRPWNTFPEERLTATLGALAGASAAQIQAIRPPLPQIPLHPKRFGLNGGPITVRDCFRLKAKYPTAQNDYTRVQPGYSGTQTPSVSMG